MRIGVDIDDVLSDLIPSLAEYHNATYGTSLTKKDFHSYAFAEVWGGTSEQSIEKIKNFKQSTYFKNLQPVSGSIEAVNILKQSHELIIITSRSNKEETEKWIEKYFPNTFSGIYYAFNHWIREEGNKTKTEICLDLKVDVLIEDSLEYALECAEKRISVLLLDSPWNKCEDLHNRITRVKNWREILDMLPLHKA